MAHHRCPVCGSPIKRIHRRPIDRLLSLFFPFHRYRCHNSACGWEGNLHTSSRSGGHLSLPRHVIIPALILILVGILSLTFILWMRDNDMNPDALIGNLQKLGVLYLWQAQKSA